MPSGVHPTHLDALGPLDSIAIMPLKRKRGGGGDAVPGVCFYTDPPTLGSLGGRGRYVHAQVLMRKEALKELRGQLAYTLHRPVRQWFPTLPIPVFHIDDQWMADLVEMQPLKRWNRCHVG